MQPKSITLPHRVKNLTRQTFNQLTAISYVGTSVNNGSTWLWQCTCGKQKVIFSTSVKRGNTKSCGCLQPKAVGAIKRTHGQSGVHRTPEYRSWACMVSRATNPNDSEYFRYGKRGVTVCKRWRTFENFLADMGRKPSPAHTIDRYPNKSGNYEPDNCRWATKGEQNRNRHNTRWVTWNGITLCATDWADHLDIHPATFIRRLNKWPLERAMTEPVNR